MNDSDKTLIILFAKYESYLKESDVKDSIIKNWIRPIRFFAEFARKQSVENPEEIGKELIKEFQVYLYIDRLLSAKSVMHYMKLIRAFYEYLLKEGIIEKNPFKDIEILPRPAPKEKRIARYYSYDEILRKYTNDLKTDNHCYSYIMHMKKHIIGFFKYLRIQEIKTIYQVKEAHLIRYREFLLGEYEEVSPRSLSPSTQIVRLKFINYLFRYLYKEGIIRDLPTYSIDWKAYYKYLSTVKPHKKNEKTLTPLEEIKKKFLSYEKTKGKSFGTLQNYSRALDIFFSYMEEKGITDFTQVDKRILLDYYSYLYNLKNGNGEEISPDSKARYLVTVKFFFRFLAKFDYIPKDISIDLDPIKKEQGLPRNYMTEDETIRLLSKPDISTPLGLRDKAVLELLYSTGIRNKELRSLNIEDIDFTKGMIRINNPKNGKSQQRIIPIGNEALYHVKEYLDKSRQTIEKDERKALFLNWMGERLGKEALIELVKKYMFKLNMRKNITPHSFRVSCATDMLRNGADIRYVQEQLGHRKITSTQIYTRLIPLDLKRIHSLTHPRERRKEVSISSA